MRPRTLDEFVGQEHLVGERGALRRMIERGHLASMVLWGPPGSGKTTLARLLAGRVDAPFATLSAVMSGVADVRARHRRAREWIDQGGRSTVLFIDEIHRFNKASRTRCCRRSRTARSRSSARPPRTPISRSTRRSCRGCACSAWSRSPTTSCAPSSSGRWPTSAASAVESSWPRTRSSHLVDISGGDARAALNMLEARGRSMSATQPDARGHRGGRPAARPRTTTAPATATTTRSARSSRACAATTPTRRSTGWRRWSRQARTRASSRAGLIISASEDVGNADPHALQVAVVGGAGARLGRPAGGAIRARPGDGLRRRGAQVEPGRARPTGRPWTTSCSYGSLPVPQAPAQRHLAREARLRHGQGYVYPHDYEGADVEQQYLPDRLAKLGRRYYDPSDHGYEKIIGERMAMRVDGARRGGGSGRARRGEPTARAKVGRHEGGAATSWRSREEAQASHRGAPEARGVLRRLVSSRRAAG